jgi:hypothetical protein
LSPYFPVNCQSWPKILSLLSLFIACPGLDTCPFLFCLLPVLAYTIVSSFSVYCLSWPIKLSLPSLFTARPCLHFCPFLPRTLPFLATLLFLPSLLTAFPRHLSPSFPVYYLSWSRQLPLPSLFTASPWFRHLSIPFMFIACPCLDTCPFLLCLLPVLA